MPARTYIGTAGWSIPRQHARAAPEIGTHLERYARVLNCAEINTSFYRPHRADTWMRWAASVPAHFRFAVKAAKSITHEAALACSPEELIAFLDQVQNLRDKLGPLLFQLPPSGAFDHARSVQFFSMLRDHYGGLAALEPRHASWFTREAESLLREYRIARVAADPLVTPEGLTPAGWTGLVYYRLHGSPQRYYSTYADTFLQPLAASVQRQQQGSEVWCIFDNTALGAAFGDALTLKRLLSD